MLHHIIYKRYFLQNAARTIAIVFTITLALLTLPLPKGMAQESNTVEKLQQQSRPVNLTQAINVALANNIQIKRSLLSVKGADQQVRTAWSGVLPEVTASASYARNIELPVFFFPADPTDPNSPLRAIQAGDDNNWNGGITVEQNLFSGEVFVGISSSQIFKAVQAENLRATTQDIVTQTRIAYYNVLIAEQQLQLQQESISRLRENVEENRIRQEAGLVDRYTVLQVEVQLSNQEPQLTQAKYAIEKAYRELKLTMGIPVDLSIRVKGNLGSFNILSTTAANEVNQSIKKVNSLTPYSFEREQQLINIAADLRGDIRVIETQNKLKEQEIKAIRSRYLPTLSTRYNINYRAEEPGAPTFFGSSDNRVRTQAVTLNLEVPIFQGFRRDANIQTARIEKRDLELQKEFAVLSAKNEIETARENLNEAIETAPAREKALEQSQEGYDRARKRLENGLGAQLDVTEAEFQLRQAELNYAQTVYNYLAAKARYDQAIGMVPFVDKSKPKLD
jgi:outer membrane protein TolC